MGIQKPPLALGEQQVERKRASSGTTDAGDHHEAAPRHLHREVLQVMLRAPTIRMASGTGEVRGAVRHALTLARIPLLDESFDFFRRVKFEGFLDFPSYRPLPGRVVAT